MKSNWSQTFLLKKESLQHNLIQLINVFTSSKMDKEETKPELKFIKLTQERYKWENYTKFITWKMYTLLLCTEAIYISSMECKDWAWTKSNHTLSMFQLRIKKFWMINKFWKNILGEKRIIQVMLSTWMGYNPWRLKKLF